MLFLEIREFENTKTKNIKFIQLESHYNKVYVQIISTMLAI